MSCDPSHVQVRRRVAKGEGAGKRAVTLAVTLASLEPLLFLNWSVALPCFAIGRFSEIAMEWRGYDETGASIGILNRVTSGAGAAIL